MNIPLNIDWQQILLHMLNTAVLFCALYFLLYKPIKRFIDSRSEAYKKIDEETKKNLADSERIKAEYEQKLIDADGEIAKRRIDAENEIIEQSEQRISDAKAEADRIINLARIDAEKQHDRIISSANDEIEELAAAAAEKLVFSDTSEAYDRFLNSVEGQPKDE